MPTNIKKYLSVIAIVNPEFGEGKRVSYQDNKLPYRYPIKIILMKMQLVSLFLCFFLVHVFAESNGQTYSIKGQNIKLTYVLDKISEQGNLDVLYNSQDLADIRVTLDVYGVTLESLLELCFLRQPLTYELKNNTLVVKVVHNESEQLRKVYGRILDEFGKPLSGAGIMVMKSNIRGVSNEKGFFEITDLPQEVEQIQITYLGKKTLLLPIKTNLGDIKLVSLTSELDEVVVHTGYQSIPKERSTGSFDIISGKQIENKLQVNVLERLEGMAPGLMMINGKDSGGDALTIRGVSTLFGTARPLIVLDNFPIEGDINSINPNDVLSVSILKDAAAASIWGARAANGVIVITTKRGAQGAAQFQYANSLQFSPKPDLNYLNRLGSKDDIDIESLLIPRTADYEQMIRRWGRPVSRFTQLVLDSLTGKINPQEFKTQRDYLASLDNSRQIKDLLMQDPFLQNHSLSLNSANEKYQFYGSLLYTDQRGYNLKDRGKNYSILLKSNINITTKLKLGVSSNFNFGNSSEAPVSVLDIYRLKPYDMIMDNQGNPLSMNREAGSLGQNSSNYYSIAQRNSWGLADESFFPLLEIDRTAIDRKQNSNRLQAELGYKLNANIGVHVSYQLEKGNSYYRRFAQPNQADLVKLINDYVTPVLGANNTVMVNPDGTLLTPIFNVPQGGKLDEMRGDFNSHVIRGWVDLDKIIGDHQIVGILGLENQKIQTSGSNMTKYGYDDHSLNFVQLDYNRLRDVSPILQTMTGIRTGIPYSDAFSYSENRFVSAFANASYTYRNKYTYTGSIRLDQTNLFGTDKKYRYSPMWSSGLSWNIKKESFMNDDSKVNEFIVRATYGINGNIPKNSGPFMIATSNIHPITLLPSLNVTIPQNDGLRWEKTAISNVGLDLSLFDYRLQLKADYYHRRSSNLLGNEQINPTYGFASAQLNTASMNNDGLEIQIISQNIKKQNFTWSTTFMFAENRNKITKVFAGSEFDNPRRIADGSPFFVGKPYGGIYSMRYGGLTSNSGQLQVLNAQGEIEPNNLNDDLSLAYFSGNGRPVRNGAFSNQFKYKDLELNFMFVFYIGHVMRQNSPFANLGVLSKDARLSQAWKKPGDEFQTSIPNVVLDDDHYYAYTYYKDFLDVNVFDAGYAKLREVILTYNMPISLIGRQQVIKSIQVNLQGRNLWTLTKNDLGIDPEAFSEGERLIPVSPTYAFGLNVTF